MLLQTWRGHVTDWIVYLIQQKGAYMYLILYSYFNNTLSIISSPSLISFKISTCLKKKDVMVKRVLVIWPLCSKSYGNLLNTRTPFLIPFFGKNCVSKSKRRICTRVFFQSFFGYVLSQEDWHFLYTCIWLCSCYYM